MRALVAAVSAAALLAGCGGPKALTLPEDPIDRAATCGVVAAAEARAGSPDIKAALPFEAQGRILHHALVAASEGGSFSGQKASAVSKRMSELQGRRRVDVDEGFLDRRFRRSMLGDDRSHSLQQREQPIGEGRRLFRCDHAVSHPGQPRPVDGHYAPTRPAKAGVQPKDANRRGHEPGSLKPPGRERKAAPTLQEI